MLFLNSSQFCCYLCSLFHKHAHCCRVHEVIVCMFDLDDIRDSPTTFPVPVIMENLLRLSSGDFNLANVSFIATFDTLQNSALLA